MERDWVGYGDVDPQPDNEGVSGRTGRIVSTLGRVLHRQNGAVSDTIAWWFVMSVPTGLPPGWRGIQRIFCGLRLVRQESAVGAATARTCLHRQ